MHYLVARFQHLSIPKSSEEKRKLVSVINSIAVTVESWPDKAPIYEHSIEESKLHIFILGS